MGQLLHRNIRQCGELLEIIQIIIQVIIQVILTTCFSLSRGAQGGSGVSSRPVVGSSLSCALNAVVLWPNWHRKPPESLLAASLSLPFLSYGTIYRELERTILGANTQEDLKWFSNNHGPGMHMNWPAFEVRRRASTQGLLLSVDFALFNPSRTPHPPGIQPGPGQRSSKEEEARRRPTHPQHRPRGATW